MKNKLSRRNFLVAAATALPLTMMAAQTASGVSSVPVPRTDRIIDIHVHTVNPTDCLQDHPIPD
jgi:hypothetical protein